MIWPSGTLSNICALTLASGNSITLVGTGSVNVSGTGSVTGNTLVTKSSLSLGTTGTTAGTAVFANATSGTITVTPPTGALGTVTLTLPAVTDTLCGIAATQTLTNKTISGASNTITNISLTAGVTGTLPIANGGTGLASYTTGDLIYASGATTLSKLADVATGNALISGGVSTAPSWGKITTSHTTGIAASGANSDITGITGLTGNVTTTAGVISTTTGQLLSGRSSGNGRLNVKDNGTSATNVVEIYADDDAPYILALYNSTYHATNPAFRYFIDNSGNFFQGTVGSTSHHLRTNNTERITITGGGQTQILGDFALTKTITAGGTTGAQTISKNSGSVNFAAAATTLVVTNTLVTTSSVIVATVATNDATMKSVAVVAASGSFTIYANAAATAETRVNFIVTN